MLYVFYRQFKGSWEGPGVNIHWHSTFALVPDPGERPILWDVYVGGEKVEWEWGGFRVSERFRFRVTLVVQSHRPAPIPLVSFLNER